MMELVPLRVAEIVVRGRYFIKHGDYNRVRFIIIVVVLLFCNESLPAPCSCSCSCFIIYDNTLALWLSFSNQKKSQFFDRNVIFKAYTLYF